MERVHHWNSMREAVRAEYLMDGRHQNKGIKRRLQATELSHGSFTLLTKSPDSL